MTCIVCRKPIKTKRHHTYAYVPNGNGGTRKVFAHCPGCEKRFDKYIDQQNEKQ
jgi:uncharacterized protein with PIN domain